MQFVMAVRSVLFPCILVALLLTQKIYAVLSLDNPALPKVENLGTPYAKHAGHQHPLYPRFNSFLP